MKYCIVESCFFPKNQEKWFSLNYCIRRWTTHSQEERCLYPHTGIYPPWPIWWCWPGGAPAKIERDSDICFGFALQTHTLSPMSAFWHLCWWEAPTSGQQNVPDISHEIAVGKRWSTNLGTGWPDSHPDIWLHGQCHLYSKTTCFCLYALTLQREWQKKKTGLLSTFQMQVGKFEVFFQVSPFKTHVFCTVACCSSHMEYLPCYSFYMLFAISGRGTKPPLFLFSNAESWRVTWHWTTTFYGIVFLWMIILCHSVIIIIIIFPFSGYKFLDYILHKF